MLTVNACKTLRRLGYERRKARPLIAVESARARKVAALMAVRVWCGSDPMRCTLAAEAWPRGIERYPASDLTATLARLKLKGHYVLRDGVPVPPEHYFDIARARRELGQEYRNG